MADIAGSYLSNQSYNPKFTYNISYSQTGRSGSAVSYRFNVSFTKTNGWYGYDIILNWNIGGTTGSKQIKSTADNSSGSISFDVNCSTNAAGGTLAAQIWTSSNSDGTHWQNKMDTGSRTVNKSTFNTAPSLSGSVSANGGTNNQTIAENQATISVSWPAATDANNNLSGYRLRVSINGGGYTELTRTASRTYSHNVSNYGEGATFQYAVDAYDSYSAWSGTIYSGKITKNTFTASTISSGSSIKYSDGNSTVSFTISGGSNTDGSSPKSRVLSCSGITVYNSSVSTGTVSLTVFRSGTTPTGPYVKFDDIKNKLASNNYTGTLNFVLTTTNNYNNSKTSSQNISVDLRTNPNAVGSCAIATTASTAYKQVGATGNYYYLPDSGRYVRTTWTAGSGKLGETITYEVYVAYDGGSWQLVADKLSSSTLSYDHAIPKQNQTRSVKYKIRTKTSYGYYTEKETGTSTLHYYNSPGLSQGTITRGATTADVIVTIKSNSSIPNINTVGSWNCYNKGTTTSVSSGTLTVSQNAQTIKVTGLTDNGQYDLKITFNDNTGFSSNDTKTIVIGANSPIFFVNKYGAGVNGVKATSAVSLNVKGSIGITDGTFTGAGGIFTYTGDANGMGMAVQSGGAMVIGSGESPRSFMETIANKANEITYITSDSSIQFVTNCQTIANRVTATLDGSGTFNATNVQVGGNNVYHTGRKPDSVVTTNGGGVYNGNGDAANSTQANIQIKSWYGIGFAPSISGQTVPQNQNAIWMNVRNGNLNARGVIEANDDIKAKGSSVVSSGSSGNNRWVRFYDGTQICWGEDQHSTGSLSMTSASANNVFGGVNKNIYFPVTFTTKPSVSVSVATNGYTDCQATGITTSLFLARAWSNYSTAVSHLYFSWIAIGRWK